VCWRRGAHDADRGRLGGDAVMALIFWVCACLVSAGFVIGAAWGSWITRRRMTSSSSPTYITPAVARYRRPGAS
jgi:hypothetical protein